MATAIVSAETEFTSPAARISRTLSGFELNWGELLGQDEEKRPIVASENLATPNALWIALLISLAYAAVLLIPILVLGAAIPLVFGVMMISSALRVQTSNRRNERIAVGAMSICMASMWAILLAKMSSPLLFLRIVDAWHSMTNGCWPMS